MTQTQMILAGVILVAMVALVLLSRRSGPRVTTIEHRRENDEQ